MRSHYAYIFLLASALGLVPIAPVLAQDAAGAQSDSQPNDLPTRHALENLASQHLRLASDSSSAARTFSLIITLRYQLAPDLYQHVAIHVICDGDNTKIIGSTEQGFPIFYMTKGLLVRVDPEHPECLETFEGGAPELNVGAVTGDKKALIELNYRRDLSSPQVAVDFGSLLDGALHHLRFSRFDPNLREYVLHEEHSIVSLHLSDSTAADRFPIETFVIDGHSDRHIQIDGIELNPPLENANPIGLADLHATSFPLSRNQYPSLGLVAVLPSAELTDTVMSAESALHTLMISMGKSNASTTKPIQTNP